MSEREDAERLGIELLGCTRAGSLGVTLYWSYVVARLLETFRERLEPERYDLALAVFERWGMIVPFLVDDDTVPRIWTQSEIGTLKRYFTETLMVIDRIERIGIDDEERRIAEARAYCHEIIRGAERLSAMGDITTEVQTFRNLGYHCKELLCVVLGPVLVSEFSQRYDALASVMYATVRLVNTPTTC